MLRLTALLIIFANKEKQILHLLELVVQDLVVVQDLRRVQDQPAWVKTLITLFPVFKKRWRQEH
ncbi:MAG: hypothetical protein CMH58_04000 [Myxococcales bacterium]|nr:hypothetical protein [Myxococcales bacterium]